MGQFSDHFVGSGRCACGVALRPLVAHRAADDVPRFNRDIRPILADTCFACHGPDSGTREAELRLDTRRGSHEWAIVPGDADGSEVIRRVTSDDPDMRMPPAESKKPPLTPEQIELLRKWINAGAKYEPHWAYIPPQRPAVPAVKQTAWPRNDIDRFLLAKQEAQGIGPSAGGRSSDARPPVVLRSDRPAADAGAGAMSSSPTRGPMRTSSWSIELLASPAFGERMATWWFDLVRFADTVGYHGDQDHRITPYRDYVIKTFNDNLPFDQFTIEQLAGDLLPNPTMWQLVATGYNRLLQTTHEGGAQDAEYRAIIWPTACGISRKRGWPARWAAPSATTTSSIRTRRKIFTACRRSSPTSTSTARSQPVGSNDAAHAAAAGDAGLDAAGLREDARRSTRRSPKLEASLVGMIKDDWEKQSRRADRAQESSGSSSKAQFVPTMITRGGASRARFASCRAATGWTSRARSSSRTCRIS